MSARDDALRRGDVPRPYLLTTPRQHYEDQAKLALFEEMREALVSLRAATVPYEDDSALDSAKLTADTILEKTEALK